MYLFVCILYYIVNNKPVNLSSSLSTVSHSSKFIEPTEGVMGTLIYSWSVRGTGDNLGLLVSGVGAVLWAEPLSCEIQYYGNSR